MEVSSQTILFLKYFDICDVCNIRKPFKINVMSINWYYQRITVTLDLEQLYF